MKRGESQNVPPVLRCLFEEHRHLAALIQLLIEKVSRPGTLGRGDLYLLRDVVGYLHDYPDEVHHPTENLLFERVVRRNPDMEGAAARLREDHAAISAETGRLLELLDRLIEKHRGDTEQEVRSACLDFAGKQQAHMRFENSEVFPAAMESLSRSDWREIERHFAGADDPLFGRAVAGRHRLLYEYLLGPADRAEPAIAGIQLLGLERMMLTAESLEQGARSWWARVGELGDEVLLESRSTFSQAIHPSGLGSAVTLPARYSMFLARSFLDCGRDLGRIWMGTVVNAVKAFGTGDAAR
jgi:hemerythrin-like domain-containing protein